MVADEVERCLDVHDDATRTSLKRQLAEELEHLATTLRK
jgi:hypothetical protein